MNRKYQIVIWYSEDDECYLAEVPELPGCIADGETALEALQEVEKEIDLWIDVNRKRGIPIPEPKGRLAV